MMKKSIKKNIKTLLRFFRLKINIISKGELSDEKKMEWLKNLNCKTIIDIGASKGNFSAEFHRFFPQAAIYAFEPLADCLALAKKKMAGVNNFHAYQVALSDYEGETTFLRSEYSGASSLLPMASLHKTLFPHTARQIPEKVRVAKLDHLLGNENLDDNILVKIDVQGEEGKVISGGQTIIS